jgi:hypothetical protein
MSLRIVFKGSRSVLANSEAIKSARRWLPVRWITNHDDWPVPAPPMSNNNTNLNTNFRRRTTRHNLFSFEDEAYIACRQRTLSIKCWRAIISTTTMTGCVPSIETSESSSNSAAVSQLSQPLTPAVKIVVMVLSYTVTYVALHASCITMA